MILVDTSVWIDHLHATEPDLVRLLADGLVVTHSFVIEELALGSLARRGEVLSLLGGLDSTRDIDHDEALLLADRLYGRGLSMVDVHLLGATRITTGCRLWTRDRRLRAACQDTGTALYA